MRRGSSIDRRVFLRGAGALGAAALVAGRATAAEAPAATPAADEGQAEVGPVEDLMREHGVLRRVLLVYDELKRRLEAGDAAPPAVVVEGARIVRSFVEDYHERSEEELVFPRFEKRGVLVDLVRVLRAQHDAGRRVTDRIVSLATAESLRDAGRRRALADALQSFGRMYRPHAAREDTVLFPALHAVATRSEFDALGDELERREKRRFGADGFERAVARVAALEKALGIHDLSQFTPS